MREWKPKAIHAIAMWASYDEQYIDSELCADNTFDLIVSCLESLAGKIAAGGTVVCETDRETDLPETVGALALYRSYRYGRVVVRIYREKG